MKILQQLLLILSRLIVRRYQPKIIGITGSVGKTSTKGAICTVLSFRWRVRQSVKSYNNEIGVPLTIIGQESANKSVIGWLKIFLAAIRLIIRKDPSYPNMLVLEMGADKPGDITYLTSLAPCDVGVLTAIAPAHLEKFETIENIAVEKRVIIQHLHSGGAAVLNGDDELAVKTKIPRGVAVYTYGFSVSADVKGSDMVISHEGEGDNDLVPVRGVSFKMSYGGSTVPVLLPGVVGQPAVMAALAGAAAGLHYGLNLIDIATALQSFKTAPGRLRLIAGANGMIILDDSYNSSPQAALMAINTFSALPLSNNSKRYAVLGDMLELGDYSETGHEEVGRRVAESHVDFLVTVGERARTICREARLAGFDGGAMFCFAEAMEVVRFLKEHLRPGDAILVKGSQAMRLERIVKELMAEPKRAEELLVRQGPEWKQ